MKNRCSAGCRGKRKMQLRLIPALAVFLILLAAGSALAEEQHTVVLRCTGGEFAGVETPGREIRVIIEPETTFKTEEGVQLTKSLLKQLHLHLEGAALRFTVISMTGFELKYALVCNGVASDPQQVRPGGNLWDVTAPLCAWLENPEEKLYLVPMYDRGSWGIRTDPDSLSLQLTYSTTVRQPELPLDRVRYDELFENSLSMLEADNPFIARYDDTADSLMTASLPLGVPYYYAGGSEDKILRRFYPSTTTHYYLDTHMYLCGLDCVGFTRLVYEKSGLKRHPSIVDILNSDAGSDALKKNDPSRWHMMLQPGDLVAVKHGTYHVMMYLGTMRMFGWTESNAGEAAELLDNPLVIHCGGNPFYYERYLEYIREQGYINTYPPDGGVTVSVIRETDQDAPHSMDTSWGKHFGWYLLQEDQPLLVFRLDDCTDIAWYGPER